MKNTKKLFALVLALVLVFTVFAGCSGGGESSTGDSSTAAMGISRVGLSSTRSRLSISETSRELKYPSAALSTASTPCSRRAAA